VFKKELEKKWKTFPNLPFQPNPAAAHLLFFAARAAQLLLAA
jgi:hypothetical protein